jgi:hypothetical protein
VLEAFGTLYVRYNSHSIPRKQIIPSADESNLDACDAMSISGEGRNTQMNINEGIADRIARVYIGDALLIIAIMGSLPSAINAILGIAGAVLVITGMAGRCPLYKLLGIDTSSKKMDFAH